MFAICFTKTIIQVVNRVPSTHVAFEQIHVNNWSSGLVQTTQGNGFGASENVIFLPKIGVFDLIQKSYQVKPPSSHASF